MATYKVLQDVEAEDKLLGPLSLRQFVYAGVAAINLYLSYVLATHHAAFMLVIFVPVAFTAGFFAFPWGRDQPTEIWALARIRFMIKPRRRVWNQSGVKELVTVTAPKVVVHNYSKGFSPEEVKNRLEALATTVDTRGWAIKNANINLSMQTVADTSDRLMAPTTLPKPIDATDVQASDDILDETSNASAQRLQTMIDKSAQDHRNKLMETLKQDTPPAQPAHKPNYWFLNQPAQPVNVPNDMVTFNTQVVTPGTEEESYSLPDAAPAPDEANIVAELEEHKRKSEANAFYGHMHTIRPLSQDGTHEQHTGAQMGQPPQNAQAPQPQSAVPAAPPQNASAPVTPAGQAAILQLASNDDLNVATIAREAERSAPQDEVVIKLH